MGLDMYLYENSRIKKELEEKIKEKTLESEMHPLE